MSSFAPPTSLSWSSYLGDGMDDRRCFVNTVMLASKILVYVRLHPLEGGGERTEEGKDSRVAGGRLKTKDARPFLFIHAPPSFA